MRTGYETVSQWVKGDSARKLLAGKSKDATPESWKSNPPPEPVKGTIWVETKSGKTSATVRVTEGSDLIDDIRFRGIHTERAAKRLDRLLDKFEKAWAKKREETK